MGWLTLVGFATKLLGSVMQFLKTAQLLNAGEARGRQKMLQNTVETLDQARRARRDPDKRERVHNRLKDKRPF
jgi:hypothetical protein